MLRLTPLAGIAFGMARWHSVVSAEDTFELEKTMERDIEAARVFFPDHEDFNVLYALLPVAT